MTEIMGLPRPTTPEGLAAFVDALRRNLAAHPDQWENATLDAFLEALAAVIRDGAGSIYAAPEDGTLAVADVANLLEAASLYE